MMDQELVTCGSHDGYLNCLDSASGSLKWKFAQNYDASQPAVYATPFCTTLTSNKEVSVRLTITCFGKSFLVYNTDFWSSQFFQWVLAFSLIEDDLT